MNDETLKLVTGVLLFTAAVITLSFSLFSGFELPVVVYGPIAAGLFAGVLLVGFSSPDRPI